MMTISLLLDVLLMSFIYFCYYVFYLLASESQNSLSVCLSVRLYGSTAVLLCVPFARMCMYEARCDVSTMVIRHIIIGRVLIIQYTIYNIQ